MKCLIVSLVSLSIISLYVVYFEMSMYETYILTVTEN